jgi:hypothetical protein
MEWSAPMLSHRPMNDRRAKSDRSFAAFTEDARASGSKATAAMLETRFFEPSLSLGSISAASYFGRLPSATPSTPQSKMARRRKDARERCERGNRPAHQAAGPNTSSKVAISAASSSGMVVVSPRSANEVTPKPLMPQGTIPAK